MKPINAEISKAVAVALALTLVAQAPLAHADPDPDPGADPDSGTTAEVVVTGTRQTGIEVAESPAPIQVLDSSALRRVGQPDLIQAIAQNVPSFTAQAFGGDAAALTLSARLRGLSPNHALVLIDGKRRHTTSNLAVLGGPYQGGAAADLNFIPVSAIERIEVLQDGAAAQYGTDAIAGVVNIILKKTPTGGQVGLMGGGYMDGGGDSGNVVGNMGFGGPLGSYLNVTAETRIHDRSDRGNIDPRTVNPTTAQLNIVNADGYPYVNKIQGDAKYSLWMVSYNSGFTFGEGTSFYSFGTYGRKHAQAYENYRTPDRLPQVYPNGFNPQEESKEDDYGATVGLKGKMLADWSWDLSSTYGRDHVEMNTINSANIALFKDTGFTPTEFHAGDFIASQWTTNVDLDRNFEIGLATPLNVAFGVEQRHETYEIQAGDAASRYKEGSQSYPGFALTDAKTASRNNEAVYVDFATSPVEKWQIDAAGRFEHFSDFGDTTVGKLTSRYDFTDAVAIRGTFSTGFRAPTLAEEYYSATNVSPSAANVQLPPNSAAAKLVGIDGLKPEKATNYSLGFVLRPIDRLTMTLDAYQIKVDDRITGSGQLCGTGCTATSPAVVQAIAANGNVLDPTVTQTGIAIFSNGLDTRTRGADFTLAYPTDFQWGHVDWSLGANYNKTDITNIKPTPAPLVPLVFYNATAISNIETASPKYRAVLGGVWSRDRLSVSLKETVYGPASRLDNLNGGPFYETKIGVTPLTDLEVAYQASALKLSVGASNLFNRYPNKTNSQLMAIYQAAKNTAAVTAYPSFSPFGINGGYYYGRMVYSF